MVFTVLLGGCDGPKGNNYRNTLSTVSSVKVSCLRWVQTLVMLAYVGGIQPTLLNYSVPILFKCYNILHVCITLCPYYVLGN